MIAERESRPAVVQRAEPGRQVNGQVSPSTIIRREQTTIAAAHLRAWMVNSITVAAWFLAVGCILIGIAHVLGGVPHGSGAIFLGLLVGLGAYYLPQFTV
jgi:hypothetical protein